ncbi:MAG TPA: enoyl-CoA hydratase [Lysinibacillus sp.]|jgi:enoyl-CoA hydratase/carnithine racemase|uniref:enoyl-CoA hydratase n=1 Tax=unclassified Lysinibacillus TaxID=2636778 RepID=UPI000738AD7C|nr:MULTISPECIES: enoyl-CoA hydratase [unclassified Lysinibacillus]HBT72253.1 enoyl-CoA hydratase [Lysinibacillus sp.]KUF35945.1 enoyl-CoA hydratase [Lysinibacillus sp. F5]WCH48239.1 enoyl-CoA hydratase [Lysinibacillus sp. OF-1]SCY51558.1 Enoyl-CoA hydratase/carnithine racemase [Lysinibacillus sp. SG9]SDB22527.1 Enoyl-CoA hydratase/carnithine racemase [Lysinibacillus sp. TC-37]
MTQLVRLELLEGSIGLITLTRPEAANAMSVQLLRELSDMLDQINGDPAVRVVLLTGAGEKAFCAGADLKERKGMADRQVKQIVQLIGATVAKVETLAQPVIAVLNGVAFGGGLELALACDLRIAATHAKLGLTETSLGIIPGAGGTQRLPRLIGLGKAKELIYTARRLSAAEAKDYGIVEYVYEEHEVMEKAQQLALEMAKNAPLSLVQAKVAINQGVEVDLATGLKIESLAYSALIPTEDRLEGLLAFQEKRAPQYSGK